MNKVVRILILSAMLFMGGQAMAQFNGAFFLGAGLPTGDFGKFDNLNNMTTMSLNEADTYAGAGIGFNAGVKWYFNVGVKGLGAMLSIDGFYNGANPDLKTAYRNAEGESGGTIASGSFNYSATPKFINVPAMLGLNYIYAINGQLGVFAQAGIGGNMRIITDLESVAKGELLGVESTITTNQDFDNAFCLAYQVGGGFEIARNLVVGVSYYDFGTARVKGEQTVKTSSSAGGNSPSTTNYRELGTAHPSMLVLRLGFSF